MVITDSLGGVVDDSITDHNQTVYRFYVHLMENEEGGFSAIVLNLPGAGSSGSTEVEALERVQEAISGVIEEYAETGEELPFDNSYRSALPTIGKFKWIVMHA